MEEAYSEADTAVSTTEFCHFLAIAEAGVHVYAADVYDSYGADDTPDKATHARSARRSAYEVAAQCYSVYVTTSGEAL